jgi:hypothetical protein
VSKVDTSAEAVEKVCSGLCEYNAYLRLREKPDRLGHIPPIHASWLQIAEDTLRALLAERDAARHALRVIYPYLDALPDGLRGQAECEVRRGRGDTP